jgi:acetyltransferase
MVRSLQQSQYACADRLADGTIIRLRPIRPEDETLLEEFAAHMSPEDMRLRFFAAMRGLSRELAARLSHIDHDSEAALLAFAEDASELLGVARFSADAGNHTAEFAIAVRSDWKRHGLGHLLMTRLIELARQRGIDELVGGVLPENTMMLQLCREFGFTIAIDPNDRQLLRVGKLLQRRLKPHRESPNSSRPLNSSGAASVLFTVIYRG